MLRKAKDFVKAVLLKLDRHIIYTPASEITGLTIELDLPRFISRQDPLIFDVGANVGQSIDMFRRMFKVPHIFAFEPSPSCFDEIRKNYCLPNVQLFNRAMGSTPGEATFWEYERPVLNSMLKMDRAESNRFRDVAVVDQRTVPVSTVDSELEALEIRELDVLKIDTQGLDLSVLKGAAKALERGDIRTILVELNFCPMYEGQSVSEDILSFLRDHGMQLVDFYEKHRQEQALAWCTAMFHKRS